MNSSFGHTGRSLQNATTILAVPAILLVPSPQQLAMQQQMQLAAQIHAWMSAGRTRRVAEGSKRVGEGSFEG